MIGCVFFAANISSCKNMNHKPIRKQTSSSHDDRGGGVKPLFFFGISSLTPRVFDVMCDFLLIKDETLAEGKK